MVKNARACLRSSTEDAHKQQQGQALARLVNLNRIKPCLPSESLDRGPRLEIVPFHKHAWHVY